MWIMGAVRGNRNRRAAELIRAYRIDAGLTPEALAHKISVAGASPVSGRTIRRIERDAVIPGVRIQFALASFFGFVPSQVWMVKVRVRP